MNLQKLHVQKIKWKPHGRNAFHWVFFFITNNKEVNHNNLLMMCCILYYNSPINASNPRIHAIKGSISYYKTNGVTTFNKHVNVDHAIITKNIMEVNSPLK
jgi:hypothetical protein